MRRPNEIFLDEGEQAPEQVEPVEDFSQEELLKQPVYIPYRRLKDPREICMLDPACGSMHFGLYAFDLFERIYEEAWDLEGQVDGGIFARSEKLKPLRETYESKEALMRDVPRLIIEHNIHGIDIDPRAVQIAGLSLWLRAQRSWQAQGIRPQDRPQILKSNVVCAEPMPGEKEMLREFTEGLEPRVLGQLVEVIFDKMQLAGEAGSLLKIEEEIEETVAKAREEFNKELLRRQDEANSLFPEFLPPRQQTIYDFTDLPDKTQFWNEAEHKILDALRKYAEQAETTQANRKRLFARDTTRGFAFIDICKKRYDVVLMNPPFGAGSKHTKTYVRSVFPESHDDLAYTFVSRGIQMLTDEGVVGCITTRTGFFLPTFSDWRYYTLAGGARMTVCADLGYGVLDALVETAAYVVAQSKPFPIVVVIDLLQCSDKSQALLQSLSYQSERLHIADATLFRNLPGNPLTYWAPPHILACFKRCSTFEPSWGVVKRGVATGDNERFLRLHWEVPSDSISPSGRWIWYAKGGEYSPYFISTHLLLDWKDNGLGLRNFTDSKGKLRSRPQNLEFFFRHGLAYASRTTSAFGPRVLPSGHGFDQTSNPIFLNGSIPPLAALAVLMTRPVHAFIELAVGSSEAAARDYTNGLIGQLPVPPLTEQEIAKLKRIGSELVELTRDEAMYDETSIEFSGFLPILSEGTSLRGCAAHIVRQRFHRTIRMLYVSYEADQLVTSAYKFSLEGILFLDRFVGIHPWSYRSLLKTDNTSGSVPVRQEAKKCYWADREIEMLAHQSQGDPEKVVSQSDVFERAIKESLTLVVEKVFSFAVGVVAGRWDVRLVLNPSLVQKLPDPFDPLPVCPPGMLIGPEGLSAKRGGIVSEEWLRARPEANTLPSKDAVRKPTIPDDEYPIRISWNGILVDDEGHPEDIVGRVREVTEVIWNDKAGDIEQEACEILGVSSLRDYFRKPGNFFADHLKRYSKSRRQAPIYWPLSTASRSYTLWLYYHRLTDQTIYTCVNDFVEPKLKVVAESTSRLRQESRRSNAEEKELERLSDLELELRDFRDELLRIAAFWKPNLNDGVQITAAPLWKLFRHTPWQKALKETWQKLEKGEYDWAHLAYSIWPERVREKCKCDKSLAIAHNLEELYKEKPAGTKKKDGGSRGKKQ